LPILWSERGEAPSLPDWEVDAIAATLEEDSVA